MATDTTGKKTWDRRKLALGGLALAARLFLGLDGFSNEEFLGALIEMKPPGNNRLRGSGGRWKPLPAGARRVCAVSGRG